VTRISLGVFALMTAIGTPAVPAQVGASQAPGKAMQQCAVEAQQRHKDIVNGMKGKPTHEIAQAIVDSDAKNPSVAECAQKRGGGGGGGNDVASIMGDNSTGNPELDGDANVGNASATKTATTPSTQSDPQPPKPNPKKKLLIGGIAAGAATIVIAQAGGGGGTSSTPSGGGPTTPTTTNWDGTYVGVARNVPASTTCPGVAPSYDERAVLKWERPGVYTMNLFDNPSFNRSITITLDLSNSFSATGPAPFNATETYTGSLATVNGTPTLNLSEQSQFGTCTTVNTSTLSKQ
jgi:hypothetical protein